MFDLRGSDNVCAARRVGKISYTDISMAPGFQIFSNLFLCLALLGALSGCQAVIWPLETLGLDLANEAKARSPDSLGEGKNQYEPVILTSNKNAIRIKYLNVGPYAQHEQVTQLIIEHCNGNYTEANRVDLRGYTTIDAECIPDAK